MYTIPNKATKPRTTVRFENRIFKLTKAHIQKDGRSADNLRENFGGSLVSTMKYFKDSDLRGD